MHTYSNIFYIKEGLEISAVIRFVANKLWKSKELLSVFKSLLEQLKEEQPELGIEDNFSLKAFLEHIESEEVILHGLAYYHIQDFELTWESGEILDIQYIS